MSTVSLRALPATHIMKLPQELIDLIIDAFASDNCKPPLARLLYVSRVFHHAVRKNLYADIRLFYEDPFFIKPDVRAGDNEAWDKPNMASFSQAINSPQGDQILGYIRKVELELCGYVQNSSHPDFPPINDPDVLYVIRKLATSRIETLTLTGKGWDCEDRSADDRPYDCDIAQALLALRCAEHLRTLIVGWPCCYTALVTGVPSRDHVTTLVLSYFCHRGCLHSWKETSVGQVLPGERQMPLPPFLTGDFQGLDVPTVGATVDACAPFRNLRTLHLSSNDVLRFPWETCIGYAAFRNRPREKHRLNEHLVLTVKEPMFPALEVITVDTALNEWGHFGLMLILKHAPMLRKLELIESSFATPGDFYGHSPTPGALIFDPTRILPFDMVPGFFAVCHELKHLKDITIHLESKYQYDRNPMNGRKAVYTVRLCNLTKFLDKFISSSSTNVNLSISATWPSWGELLDPLTWRRRSDTDYSTPSPEDIAHLEAWTGLAGLVRRRAGKSLEGFSLALQYHETTRALQKKSGEWTQSKVYAEMQQVGKMFHAPGLRCNVSITLNEYVYR